MEDCICVAAHEGACEKSEIGGIEARKTILGRDVNQLVGRMLTFIDATSANEAQKDIIKTMVWDWFIQVPPRD